MWKKDPDGSIIGADGKVIYFSCERFVRDICLGQCCFICGASPNTKRFNSEHVIPDWVLRQFNLHRRMVSLPNEAQFRYDQFTVPCCEECNLMMGNRFEENLSATFKGGMSAVRDYINDNSANEIFLWMALIFLKTHLKDREFRFHLDRRKGEEKIADLYSWDDLHHVHCLARAFYSGATISGAAMGSLLIFEVRQDGSNETFDFADLTTGQAMLLRVGQVGCIAVFNDSGGTIQGLQPKLDRITGPVSEVQLREILAEAAFVNMHLKFRPSFFTRIDTAKEEHVIHAQLPDQFDLKDLDFDVRGTLLERVLREAIPRMKIIGATQDEVMDSIRKGRFSTIFNDKGEFIEKNFVGPMS